MKHTTRVAALAATTLLGVGVLAACGSSSSAPSASSSHSASSPMSSMSSMPSTSASSSSSASASASTGGSTATKTAVVTIKNYAYSGATSVAAGTMITVKNEDSAAHTITADSGGKFDVKVDPGKSVTFAAPKAPGSYPYHCTYHSNMHGALKVS